MKRLDDKTDLLLMMEFRQTYVEKWKMFCKSKGYKPEVDE
jgi:hypothetical protein